MMHISTSPQYSIIASLDVASAMMEGPAGRSLLQEMFDEALSFRRALANLRQHIAADDWWFSIWQPPVEGIDRVAADWLLQPEATGTALARWPTITCCSTRSRSPW
jgi:arginine decarboxylase